MTQPLSNPPEAEANAPKVVVLPDAMFFVRAVPVTPDVAPAELASQVELALEAVSPFPPAQLYHGYFWVPGSPHALVFAAYRRRFAREQVETWAGAELVLPAFATLLGEPPAPGSTVLLPSAEGLTSIHWGQGPVPTAVGFRPWPADASPADRAAARDELLRLAGGSRQVVELEQPPLPLSAGKEDEFLFRAGAREARLAAELATSLDVRDKAELAALRRARGRDVMLWRAFVGSVAAILLLALAAGGLYGAGFWQRTREMKVGAQQPVVDQVMTAQNLTARINELSTKRLLPLEMISQVTGAKPASIQFLRATTEGLYTLRVDAQTNSPGEVSTFRSAVADLPACEKVEVRDQRTRDNVMSFMLVVTFRAEALKPATPS